MTFPYIDDTVTKHLVTLNGNVYVTYSNVDVQEQPASQFAVKVSQGPPSHDTQEDISTWVMSNWTPGLGKLHADFREDAGRFWWSDGLDTRFPGQLTLGPLVQQLGATQTLDYDGALRSYHTTWKSKDFFSLGERVYRNDSGTLVQVFDWGTESGGSDMPVEGLVPFTDSSGTSRLYVFSNGERFFFSTDADGATPTWTRSDAGVIGRNAFEFQRHLVICDGINTVGELSKSLAPDGAAASYTSLVNMRTGGTAILTGTVFMNRAGESTPFFVVADDTGGEQSGLWALDFYAMAANLVPLGRTPRRVNPSQTWDAMTELLVWNGYLWVPDQASLIRITPDLTMTDVSPVESQGLPAGYLEFGPLTNDRFNLYCAMGDGSHPMIGAYNGVGLHVLVNSGLSSQVTGISISTSQSPARLYWTETDGTDYKVMYVEPPVSGGNPLSDSTYKYAQSQFLITPWVDLGFSDISKILLRMRIHGENIATDASAVGAPVRIEYQLETGTDGGTWTLLDDFEAVTDVLQFGSGAGVECLKVRFRISITRGGGAPNTVTAVVRALILDYLVTPDYRAANSFWIDLGKTLRFRQQTGSPTTVAGLLSELEAAYEASTLVNYQWDQDTARRVKVVSYKTSLWDLDISDPETGSSRDGLSQVQVLQVIA